MTERNTGSSQDLIDLHRRHFLRGVAASPFAGAALSTGAHAESSRQITVSQGGEVVDTVVPYSYDDMDVVEFYNYDGRHRPGGGDGASANTPNGLEQVGVSQLFFYEHGGTLSLVVIHDEPNAGNGGSARLEFGDLPSGQWAVKDDPTHAPDEYGRDRTRWRWGRCCTDGGAYTFEDAGPFEFSVTPREYDGGTANPFEGIGTWQLLSGDGSEPAELDLDGTAPVTIQVGEKGFDQVAAEKRTMADHITGISQSIDEASRVQRTLEALGDRVDAGEVDEDLAVESVRRMKHGENVSEFLLAGFSPVTVPDTEAPGSLVGIQSRYDDYDVAGHLVEVGISWALELLVAIGTIIKVSKYFFGLKRLAGRALSRARSGVRTVLRTLFGKFPHIKRAVRLAAANISDDMLSVMESGVTEGGKLATQIAAKISGVRDGIANRIVEQFENDGTGLVVPTDVDGKLQELDEATGGNGEPEIGGGTDVDVDGIADDALDALDEEMGNTQTLLSTANDAILAVSFLSLAAQLIVAATGIGIVASGAIEFLTIIINLSIATVTGIGALTIMQHSLSNHNRGIDAIVAGDEGVSYTVL